MVDQAPGNPQGPHNPDPQDAHSLPGCYRHPDRETGVRCTRCERPICPECMVSASVGFHCPACVRDGSGTGHAPTASQPRTLAGGTATADPRPLTKILLGINAAMFLHSGYVHILFNMLSLWWIGGPLEAALGRARYLTLYLVSGLAGSALTYLIADANQPSLGASGAIFGLFGATAVLMRRLKYDMRPVIALLVINLIFTFSPAFNIAWQAHIGGLVAGVVMGYAM